METGQGKVSSQPRDSRTRVSSLLSHMDTRHRGLGENKAQSQSPVHSGKQPWVRARHVSSSSSSHTGWKPSTLQSECEHSRTQQSSPPVPPRETPVCVQGSTTGRPELAMFPVSKNWTQPTCGPTREPLNNHSAFIQQDTIQPWKWTWGRGGGGHISCWVNLTSLWSLVLSKAQEQGLAEALLTERSG